MIRRTTLLFSLVAIFALMACTTDEDTTPTVGGQDPLSTSTPATGQTGTPSGGGGTPRTTAAPSGGTGTPGTIATPGSNMTPDASGSPTADPATGQPGTGELDTLNLVIEDGPAAGTYELNSQVQQDGICVREQAGNINFLYMDFLNEESKVTSVIGTNDVPEDGDFNVTIDISDPATQYEIQDAADIQTGERVQVGEGTMEVEDNGDTATITFEGAAEDGTNINFQIECQDVAQ